MTVEDGVGPHCKGYYRVAKTLADRVVRKFQNEAFLPGKTVCHVKIIGMSPVLCLSVGTLLHQSERGSCTHARLIVLLPAMRQLRQPALHLLQDTLDDIGVALEFYQRHSAYFNRFADQPGLKSCLVCEKLQYHSDEWLRWDELLVRQVGASLSHTICSTCATRHYAECSGAKNGTAGLPMEHQALFNAPEQVGCIDVCAICEQLKTETGSWERWDQYIKRLGRMSFTHALCSECCDNLKVEG
jgi:hypothetical protein